MRVQKTVKGNLVSVVLVVLSVFFVFELIGQPGAWAADEKTPKEKLTQELPPGETGAGGPSFMDRLLFIADFDAFVTRSKIHGEESLSGASVNGLFAPVYQANDRTFLILMYDGHYYRKREFYSDEEGSRERTEFQSHTIQPMVRFDFGDRAQYSLTPSVFHTATFNRDRETSGWRDGLYNYRDYGAGVDFDMRQVYGDAGTLSFGVQYYQRKYPNYASLLSQTGLDLNGQQNVERNEKDYHGMIGKAGYGWIKPLGLSWNAEYSLLYKRLDDKRVVDSNGVLTGDKQRDYLHSLDVNCKYVFDIAGGLKLGLDLNGSLNDSNQNYWDEKITGLFSSQKYTSDYYDYTSYRIRPNISYTFALWPLTPSISYSYYRVTYDERKAKYSNGDYKSDHHYEQQQAFVLGLEYDLTDNWSLLAQWENLVQRSNNEDQRTYRYAYSMDTYMLGVSFKY